MKILIVLVCILGLCSCKEGISIAEVGKEAPNYSFTNILNSDAQEISLEELKGKIVILEFWASWCSPCLPVMEKLSDLQQEFKEDLEIITISSETNERLNKYIRLSNSKLRIVSDTLHNSIFRYTQIPHTIVIDREGIVRAITEPKNITRQVISKLLANNEINVPIKDDFTVDQTIQAKTIKSVNNSNYRMKLESYDPEKPNAHRILKDPHGNTNGVEILNLRIPDIFRILYDAPSNKRLVYEDGLQREDFPDEKEYYYNLLVEVSKEYDREWNEMGIEFLNKNLEINAKKDVDNMSCYVLIDSNNSIKPSIATGREFSFRGSILKTKKISMQELAKYLENFTSIPVVDKTNLNGEYDIELDWQQGNPETLHEELKKYGLKLVKADKKLPVEVVKIYEKKK